MLKNGEELDGMKYSDIRSSARQHRYPKYKNQMGKSTGNTVTLQSGQEKDVEIVKLYTYTDNVYFRMFQ